MFRITSLLLVASSAFAACTISISTPTSGTISGTAVPITAPPSGCASAYEVVIYYESSNGNNPAQDSQHIAGRSFVAPWSINWNSNYLMNGPYATFQAVVYDAAGTALATSTAVQVTINNRLPVANSVFSGTYGFPGSWTGNVNITHAYSGTDSAHGASSLWVDGKGLTCGASPCVVPTASFSNGTHIVRQVGYDQNASLGGQTNWQATLEHEEVATFSNGATNYELRMVPGYEVHVCATPTSVCPASIALSGQVYATDGTHSLATFPSGPTFTGVDIPNYPTAPVTLSSCSSCNSVTVTYQAVGTVQLLFTDSNGFTRVVWVHADTNDVTGHFASNGTILTNYTPGSSTFFTSPFASAGCPFNQSGLSGCGDLLYPGFTNYSADMVKSGFNAAEFGCGSDNPGWSSPSQATWVADFNGYVSAIVGNYLVSGLKNWNCAGDNMTRGNDPIFYSTQGIMSPSWVGGSGYSTAGVTLAMRAMINSGLISVQFTDEVSDIFGSKPRQIDTWANDIASFSCVNGVNCTVVCNSTAASGLPLKSGCDIQNTARFLVTGTGDANMDYNLTTGTVPYIMNGNVLASNGGYSSFTFPTPSGVGNKTYTSGANPGLQIQWNVNNTFRSSTGADCGGSPPCPYFNPNGQFDTFMGWIHAAAGTIGGTTGRPAVVWPTFSGYNAASVQNWMGDPVMSDMAEFYFGGNAGTFMTDGGSVYAALNMHNTGGVAYVWRNKYAAMGPNRPSPLYGEGAGTAIDYGIQGYPVSVTSVTGSTINFAAAHGIHNVQPYVDAIVITGNTAANGNYYIRECPTPTTCTIAQQFGTVNVSYTGSYTVTADTGATWTSTGGLFDSTSNSQAQMYVSSGACVSKGYRGHVVTISGSGTSMDGLSFWLIPPPFTDSTCGGQFGGRMLEVPNFSSATGGSASIQRGSNYLRGINWIGPGSSENGARYSFNWFVLQEMMGASGMRVYQTGLSYNDTHKPCCLGSFGSTVNSTVQAGLHPRYPEFGTAQTMWDANGKGALIGQRFAPCWFQPKGSSPDYGDFFESATRFSSGCNLLAVMSLADNTLSPTIDLTPIVVGGQTPLKWCLGQAAFTATVLSVGVTSDTPTMDPDKCSVVVYVGTSTPTSFLPLTYFGVNTSDGSSGTTDVVLQWSYSQLQFSNPQIDQRMQWQEFDCGGSGACLPPIDVQFGTVYWRELYRNSSGTVLATSGVHQR